VNEVYTRALRTAIENAWSRRKLLPASGLATLGTGAERALGTCRFHSCFCCSAALRTASTFSSTMPRSACATIYRDAESLAFELEMEKQIRRPR